MAKFIIKPDIKADSGCERAISGHRTGEREIARAGRGRSLHAPVASNTHLLLFVEFDIDGNRRYTRNRSNR